MKTIKIQRDGDQIEIEIFENGVSQGTSTHDIDAVTFVFSRDFSYAAFLRSNVSHVDYTELKSIEIDGVKFFKEEHAVNRWEYEMEKFRDEFVLADSLQQGRNAPPYRYHLRN